VCGISKCNDSKTSRSGRQNEHLIELLLDTISRHRDSSQRFIRENAGFIPANLSENHQEIWPEIVKEDNERAKML
jgi:hypothetical protein